MPTLSLKKYVTTLSINLSPLTKRCENEICLSSIRASYIHKYICTSIQRCEQTNGKLNTSKSPLNPYKLKSLR